MGREATITPEQVYAVADAIKAQGDKPTLRAVRERLGGGSMGTIARILQQWKAGEAREAREVGTEITIPPALQKALMEFVGTATTAARAPLESELADQQQAATELAAENERQTETIRDLSLQIEGVTADKAGIEGKAAQLAADLATARDEITRERQAAEVARVELAKAALRLEGLPRLEAEIAALRAERDHERQGRVQAEQEAAVLTARVTDLRERLDDAKGAGNATGRKKP